MDSKKIKELENIALSDTQIMDAVNNDANLVLYPNIHKYDTIESLLGPHNACIILYESKPGYGHWCCVFKVSHNELEFFNSYGNDPGMHDGLPDGMLNLIPEPFRNESKQNHTYLAKLMVDSPYNLSYNQYRFQKDGPAIRTCGRHVACRLNMRNKNLDEYYRIIKKYCNELKLDADGVVSYLTHQIN